ncbi:MAG: hypothetical protein L0228_02675 [Planctomycetes bacterium]|nr:hypothetical protein [Planctomycetota bacterium]
MSLLRATGQEEVISSGNPFVAVLGVEGQAQEGGKTPVRNPIFGSHRVIVEVILCGAAESMADVKSTKLVSVVWYSL